MMGDQPGRVFTVCVCVVAAAIGACEAGSGGHLVINEPLAPLEACPEPICPEPVCPAEVPAKKEAGEAAVGSSASGEPTSGGLVDLNSASIAELDTLPGVGRATAERIVSHRQSRPFRSARDLMRVKGIGPAKWSRLKDRVSVGAAP